jgi:hypothetical protein
MEQLIGYFSSDARPLYKEDIFRALALPSGSVIHFRYDQKYIQDDIVTNPDSFIDTKGIIFFVTGNDLNIPENERKKQTYSIRMVTLKGVSRSEDTRHFHFFLRLDDFCYCTIASTESRKFVSRIAVNYGTENRWIERVKVVKDDFDDILFFKYEVVDHGGNRVKPKYSKYSQDAVYELLDESEYRLDFSFFDKRDGASNLSIEESEGLSVHYRECSKLGATIDDRQFRLHTGFISHMRKPAVLKFRPTPNDNQELDYEVISFFDIKKNIKRTALYGLLTALGFAGIVLSQVIGAFVKLNKPTCLIIGLSIVAIILFGIAGAFLFGKFNKK